MTISLNHIFIIKKSSIEKYLIVKKSGIAFGLMFVGMAITILGSMNVWFVWPINTIYAVFVFPFLFLSWMISHHLQNGIYQYNKRIWAAAVFLFFQLYVAATNGDNFNAVIMGCFYTTIVLALLALKSDSRQRLGNDLSIGLGCILAISIPTYMMYIVGIPLPNVTISNGLYTFSNYFFFLTDPNTDLLFPRYRSIFLEPGHIGTISALLLFTQIGRWHKWYNMLMIAALVMSFSLAAYVLFAMIIFISMWMQRKQVLAKLLVIVVLMVAGGVWAYFYNNGNNLVNQLILSRMEVNEDGKLSGDNRVTDTFGDTYDQFLKTGNILTGEDFSPEKFGFGNSGYRVFIYNYGLLGLLINIVFYLSMMIEVKDRRAFIGVWLLAIAVFYERATLMSLYNIIPLYIVAYWRPHKSLSLNAKERS